MKITNLFKPARLLLSLFLGWLLLGLGTIWFKGAADYPCFARFDSENQCVVLDEYYFKDDKQLDVFLSTYQVGVSGGGCFQESSNTNLELDNRVKEISLQKDGETLHVNGNELAKGETFSFVKFWNFNPWTVYYIEFTNYGVMNACNSKATPEMIVIGDYGNRLSLIKAVSCLALIILVYGWRKYISKRNV